MNADRKLIDALIAELSKISGIEQAVLFGSRARGDNTDRSDYDVAIFGNVSQSNRIKLRVAIDELPTLHKIDVVFMQDDLDPKFRDSIISEGIKIYV